jgi:hypothetical protein
MTLSLKKPATRSTGLPQLRLVLRLVSCGGLGDDHLGGERWTWNTVLFRSPGSQVRDLTTLRTEWTPGVCIPGRGLVAQGAGHGCSVTSEPSEVQSLERGLLLRHWSWPGDLEQPLQPTSIQVREA